MNTLHNVKFELFFNIFCEVSVASCCINNKQRFKDTIKASFLLSSYFDLDYYLEKVISSF